MKHNFLVGVATLSLLIPQYLRAQEQPSRFNSLLSWGPYEVGFRVVEQYDKMRVEGTRREFSADPTRLVRGRPIQTLIWYPAQRSAGLPRMRFRDYAETYAEPGTFPRHDAAGRQQAVAALLRFLGQADSTATLVQTELRAPVHASRDAAVARGAFPVVIYGPGSQGPAIENDLLAEYLASHGYIFIATPSWGPFSYGFRSLESPARDLEYLVGFARSLPNANSRAVALMGHSLGGMANVLVASRNASIAAVVSLEGSVAYLYLSPLLVQAATPIALREYAVPSLFVNQSRAEIQRMIREQGSAAARAFGPLDTTFAFFDSLRYADGYAMELKGMRHRNFCSLENRLLAPGMIIGVNDPLEFNPDRAVASRGYAIMATATLHFLDSYLKGDTTAIGRLGRDLANGHPEDVTLVHKVPWPDLSVLVHKLQSATPTETREAAEQLRTSVPGYTDLNESRLTDWTLQQRRKADAIAGSKVLVSLYQDSPIANQTAGYIARDSYDSVAAIRYFRKALQIDSSRTYLKNEITRLEYRRPR